MSDDRGRTAEAVRPGARARLIDVATMSGVTKSVASRVINGDPTLRARPETRARVLAAAHELGYRPHAGARALSVARTGTLAFLIPDLMNSVYATILRGAMRRARELGYVVLVAEDAAESPAGADEYENLVIAGRVDGLLVASAHPGNAVVDRLLANPRSIAHVFVNRVVPAANCNVGLDMRGASALAVDHLTGLGHSKIGLVTGPLEIQPLFERAEGFTERMSELGLDPTHRGVGELSERGGFAATLDLLARSPELTALFVSTFGQAVGALAAARKAGRSVPSDLSLIGYDDLPTAEFLDPPLTTIGMPLDRLGAAAVDAVLLQLTDGTVEDVWIPDGYQVITRGSVAVPKA